jgi:Polyketide cyclase / dehydrase and lipid transport
MTVHVTQLGPETWQQRFSTTAPPETAFDYIADFQRHPEWERELLSVQPRGAAGRGYLKIYGTRATGLAGRIFSPRLKVTCKVKEVARPRRIVWRQYRSGQASGPNSFQKLELVITPSKSGSLIVLTRWFLGTVGSGIEMATRISSRFGPVLQGLPPEVRAAGATSSGGGPELFSMPDEVVRRALEGHPSRGPGPTSLEHLKANLDSGGRAL